jgi:hypothetical protein
MGFNKRYFSMEMLANYHKGDREFGIEKAIGKTDGFIFTDEGSKEVLDLWMEGKKEEARKILDNHVHRIPSKISPDS